MTPCLDLTYFCVSFWNDHIRCHSKSYIRITLSLFHNQQSVPDPALATSISTEMATIVVISYGGFPASSTVLLAINIWMICILYPELHSTMVTYYIQVLKHCLYLRHLKISLELYVDNCSNHFHSSNTVYIDMKKDN